MIFLGKELGPNKYPFIVAEISCNHEGNIEQAKQLIQAAKDAGADAVKIQIYTPDDMTIDTIMGGGILLPDKVRNPDFYVKEGPWKGKNLYELYSKTQTHNDIAEYMILEAKKISIPLFTSIFHPRWIPWGEEFKIPAYKIASFEITDTNLIRQVAKTGKPIIISTGLASTDDIYQAMQCVNPENTILLHCVSAYPTKLEQTNLWRIKKLQVMCPNVGFSDHTRGAVAGPLACAMGAIMVEKHLALPGTHSEDASFSLHPDEFELYVIRCRSSAAATFKTDVPEEEQSRQFRRSIYIVKNIKKGELFTQENIKCIRPNYGYSAQKYSLILTGAKYARCDLKAGTALKEEHITL